MSSYPVFESLLAQGTTTAEILQAIVSVRNKDDKNVDVASKLFREWRYASTSKKTETKEAIADILFNVIVKRALEMWLRKFLAAGAYTLVPQDFEDWISTAMAKIWIGNHYDPDRKFLGWAYKVALYCWIDKLREDSSNTSKDTVSWDEEVLEPWEETYSEFTASSDELTSNPEALALQADLRERLSRLLKTGSDKKILWAVYAGVPWHSTRDIAALTGLSLPQVTKCKERIKKAIRTLGIEQA